MIAMFRLMLLRPIIKPLSRLLVGLIAIPIFRLVVRHGFRAANVRVEMEKDLEQWFRACLILLVATANMEHALFGWLPVDFVGADAWIAVFLRLFLAIGVIELMPDQALFGLIHTSPTGLKFHRGLFQQLWVERKKWLKKVGCIHLNRSSPIFLIMAAIFGGDPGTTKYYVGWTCYGVAVVQYLIIAFITSAYKGGDLMERFDTIVAQKRQLLKDEFVKDAK